MKKGFVFVAAMTAVLTFACGKKDHTQNAKKLFEAAAKGNEADIAKVLDDGCTFSGPVPEPIPCTAWAAMHTKLAAGFPDWNFNISNLKGMGDSVTLDVMVTGTHKGDLDLSLMFPEMRPIKATNKPVQNPKEAVVVMYSPNGKVKSVAVAVGEGGVMGILRQIGAEVPKKK